MHMWKHILLPVGLVLALGLASGLFIGTQLTTASVSSPTPNIPPPTPETKAANSRPEQPELLERLELVSEVAQVEELAHLKQENATLKNQLSAVLRWILDNVRGRYPLDEGLVSHLDLPVCDAEGRLSNELITLLNITPTEQDELNDIFGYIYASMNEVEAVSMRANQPYEGKVILRIPPYVEDGDRLKEDLYAAMETSLGRPRFERFLEVSENQLQQHFHQFGQAARTIIFELGPPDTHGRDTLIIRDGWIQDDEFGVRTIHAKETVVNELPETYTAFQDFLPMARH